jgi:hypothetical protein
MRQTLSIAVLLSGLSVATAHAHIQLDFPPQRYTDQKAGPCGRAGDPGRGEIITVFEPGQLIMVSWRETINHPGHFRISFDADGQDDFFIPATETTCDTGLPVLADCIADLPGGGMTGMAVTLPNIECENCTLQVIQVMTDKPPYGDGNDIYYQCADIALRAGGGPDAGPTPDADPNAPDADPGAPDAGVPDPMDGGGCCDSGGTTPGTGLLALLVLFGLAIPAQKKRQLT